MKKALSILACAMLVPLLSSPAWADDDAAYSANAVGVVKYEIPAEGGFTCITLPLEPIGGGDAWLWSETTLAQQLPNGSYVYFWDSINSKWEPSWKFKNKWQGLGQTQTVAVGEAIFIRSATTAAAQQISLLGELPTDPTMPLTVTGSSNFDTIGVTPYPVEVPFASSALASNLPNNSYVYFWQNNKWEPSWKFKNKWQGLGASWTNKVGQGMFVRSAATAPTTINITRPFEW